MGIKYLVFSGGGAAGYAYAGAVEQLSKEPEFSFDALEGVAGASIGSIAALLVSLNSSPHEVSQKIASLDLKKLKDGGYSLTHLYRILSVYGKYKGEEIDDFIKKIIKDKTGRSDPENVTFADLKNLGFKNLHIVTTKLYKENSVPTGKQKIFSFEKTPNTSVATAIRASVAAPIYFSRVRLKKVEKGKYIIDEKNGDLYEDGGVLNNFPIEMFDKPKYMGLPDDNATTILNPHTLGLALRKTYQINDLEHKPVKTPIYDYHPVEYTEGLVNGLLNQVDNEKFEKDKNRQRTVQIDRLGVSLADFAIDEKTIQALIESGREAVKRYFADLRLAINAEKSTDNFSDKQVTVGKLWQESTTLIQPEEKKPAQKSWCQIM